MAGFTGKCGIWREKAKGQTQLSGQNPRKCGQRPHLSGANDVGWLFTKTMQRVQSQFDYDQPL